MSQPSAEDLRHHRLRLEISGLPYRPLDPPAEHHVVLRGMRFHYLEWGNAGGTPLLFLHGGGQTCRTWDVVCHELSRDHRCIALDQRGHGDSEWSYTGDYALESHAGDIEALIEALGLPPVVLVGMSMGCLNAIHLTLRRPDAVAALVAVDAGPWIRAEGSLPIRSFLHEVTGLDQLDQFVDAALRFNPRRDARLLRRSLLHNLRRAPDGSLMWKTDRRRPLSLETMVAWVDELKSRVGEIGCPTLVVRGSESEVFRDEDARRFAEAVPDGRWVRIEGAGHSVQGDRPRELIEALRDFLASLPED
ncbi:MAG: alpha/beta hydrolase [Myxococcota bacterium]|nr:alpha/beta hydrolase [Myxococcota bacterium]